MAFTFLFGLGGRTQYMYAIMLTIMSLNALVLCQVTKFTCLFCDEHGLAALLCRPRAQHLPRLPGASSGGHLMHLLHDAPHCSPVPCSGVSLHLLLKWLSLVRPDVTHRESRPSTDLRSAQCETDSPCILCISTCLYLAFGRGFCAPGGRALCLTEVMLLLTCVYI